MRGSWDAVAVGESGATAALAGFAAARLLCVQAQERRPVRQQAAMALGLSAMGVCLVSLHGIVRQFGGADSPVISTLVGLPALAGQTLTALLLWRKR